LTEESARAAADAAFADARPRQLNRFKLDLGKETLVRALLDARDMKV
jgi:xanthine dehydrogenase YagS FAD-binding subunit